MVEHGGVGGDGGRVHLGQVDDAGAEPDLRGPGISVAKKMSGEVMRSLHELKCSPTKASVKPETVGEDDGLLVLREDLAVVPIGVVERHGEHAEA